MDGELQTSEELVGRESAVDPAFRARWERLAVARAVAAEVIAYRADHGMSQRELAARLGIAQPQVARLESGEHQPAQSTLVRLASRLGLEFTISIAPSAREPVLLTGAAREAVQARYEQDAAVISFASASTKAAG